MKIDALPKLQLTYSTEYRTFLALNAYRVAIGLLLVGLRLAESNRVLHPTLFHWLTFGYGSIGFLLGFTPKKWVSHILNRRLLILDILFTGLLLNLNRGSGSGMALVLLPMLTGVAVSAQGREALKHAIAATGVIFGVEIGVWLTGGNTHFWHMLSAGFSYLAVAIIAERQGALLQAQQAVVEQQEIDLANLEQLNQRIIQDMPTGVIVIDQYKHPYRHNQQAERLLGCYTIPSNISPQLQHFSQELAELHDRWCQGEALESASFLVPSNQRMLHPRWVALHHGHRDQGAVIYLEDMGEIKAHAQRMKLAALGRLTANIAHEIRNPLSSIRYAAELLHEQHQPETPNHHLTRIMVQNVQRINHIIEEVMQLNHRDKAKGEHILLAPLISKLIQEKIDTQILPANAISLSIPENLDIWCDPFHVERVLWNLISNAWRHSQQQHGSVKIHARFGYTEEVSIIDINDDGHGISPDYQRHLFEPFATTHKQGNGLGLYIARELTEANHGTLEYIHDEKKEAPHTGAHFRVILPRHPLYTTLPDVD